MKVLVVSNMYPDKKFPSAGIFVKKFCDQLSDIGVEYELSVMRKRKNPLGKLWGYFAFYSITLLRLIIFRYDIVYIHYASHSSIPVLWARKWKHFMIYTNLHGGDVIPVTKRQQKFQKYTVRTLSVSEKVVVPSQYFKEYTAEKYNLPDSRIYVYPSGGIDREVFRPYEDERKESIKRSLQLKENCKTFLYAGRITEGKGWDVYLKAIRRLEDLGYQGNYVVVGDGNELGQYLKLVKSMKLEDTVVKLPLLPQEKLAELYNITDAFIFPTMRKESLGLVAIEAMACKAPVIGSDYAALKYYIKDNVNGFKIHAGSDQELAERMAGFIDGCYSEKQLREGAFMTAAEYDSVIAKEQLKHIFELG